jgi:hypothetical protein
MQIGWGMSNGLRLQAGEGYIELSEADATQLANALDLAANQYAADARMCEENGQHRLAEQFRRQVETTRRMCNQLAELGFC